MREKYESLSLVVLKDLAKARGLKGISTMKKGELIDRICISTVEADDIFFDRSTVIILLCLIDLFL